MELKEAMGVEAMARREAAVVPRVMDALEAIPGVHVLARGCRERQAIVSFYVETVHYNLMVRLLNDRFGIQSRGGCSCAGTYGHYLLNVDPSRSKHITDRIDAGDLSEKPGWVRLSFHPSTTMADVDHCLGAVAEIVRHADAWSTRLPLLLHHQRVRAPGRRRGVPRPRGPVVRPGAAGAFRVASLT